MSDPFCSKEAIAETEFYRSAHFIALYNIRPVSAGHSLLVSKRHVTRITELTEEEAKDMNRAMKDVIPVLVRLYGTADNSYNLVVQAGPSSDGTVHDHLHIHIIPRRPGDRYHGSLKGLDVDIAKNLEDLGSEHVKREVARLREQFKYKME